MHLAVNSFFIFHCENKAWRYRHECSNPTAECWPPVVEKYIPEVVLARLFIDELILIQIFNKCINFIIFMAAIIILLFNIWQLKQIRTKLEAYFRFLWRVESFRHTSLISYKLRRLLFHQDIKIFLDEAPDGVIYFSMGSNLNSSQMPEDKKQAFLEAFSKLKQKVLWKWETDSLPGQPNNVKLGKWLPQSDILGNSFM